MSGTWSFNPTAKIHSGICSPLDFTISNLTDNSQTKDGLFSVARYSRPYDIASPTGFADDKIYVTDFGRIRLISIKNCKESPQFTKPVERVT